MWHPYPAQILNTIHYSGISNRVLSEAFASKRLTGRVVEDTDVERKRGHTQIRGDFVIVSSGDSNLLPTQARENSDDNFDGICQM